MFAQLLKEADSSRACSIEELSNDLRRILKVQFKEFLYYLNEDQIESTVIEDSMALAA